MLLLISLLLLKHFLVEFPLQPRYMYANKGNLRHLGGWFHAGLHATVTFGILNNFCWLGLSLLLASAEFFAHYIIDYSKVHINERMGWGPTTHEQFWWLLGLDQLLHQMCYVAIVWVLYG